MKKVHYHGCVINNLKFYVLILHMCAVILKKNFKEKEVANMIFCLNNALTRQIEYSGIYNVLTCALPIQLYSSPSIPSKY